MEKNTKNLVIICIGLLLLVGFVKNIFNKNDVRHHKIIDKKPVLVFNERQYYSKWSDNINEDFIKISSLLGKNNITGCGEYYYNEIENNTFIIACTRDGKNFNYFVAWTAIDKIMTAKSNLLTVLIPPK